MEDTARYKIRPPMAPKSKVIAIETGTHARDVGRLGKGRQRLLKWECIEDEFIIIFHVVLCFNVPNL